MTSAILDALNRYDPSRSLERVLYVDPLIYDFDIRAVYGKHWLLVGHESELANIGDYMLLDVGPYSLIIVRQSGGTIAAFHNLCRHRGARLCTEQNGNKSNFVCPYHGWGYGLDGSLRFAPRMPGTLDKSRLGLLRCHTAVAEGLVFVSLAENPPEFLPCLEAIKKFAGPHDLRSGTVCASMTLLVHANWKVVAENSWECYHCPTAHSLYSRIMPYAGAVTSRQVRAASDFQAKWEERTKARGYLVGALDRLDDSVVWCQRYPVRDGFFTQSTDGRPVAPLMGAYKDYDCGVTLIQMNPACEITICNDHAKLTRITPRDIGVTEVRFSWIVNSCAVDGVDFRVDQVTAFGRQTLMEDVKICENTQQGILSPCYYPGPLSQSETDVTKFHRWYIAQLRTVLPMQ